MSDPLDLSPASSLVENKDATKSRELRTGASRGQANAGDRKNPNLFAVPTKPRQNIQHVHPVSETGLCGQSSYMKDLFIYSFVTFVSRH